MPPTQSLPINSCFSDESEYTKSLLNFASSCPFFQTICGGVHILDFLTKEPSLYASVLPNEWQEWFCVHTIEEILDLLLHEDISEKTFVSSLDGSHAPRRSWHDGKPPPESLSEYVLSIRKFALKRDFVAFSKTTSSKVNRHVCDLEKKVAIGMKPKKIHEVQHFARYINDLTEHINHSSPHTVSRIIDFGSGQNYLGRTLASSPYEWPIVALESKQLNITEAKSLDVTAKLAEKIKRLRNKKEQRSGADETRILSGEAEKQDSTTPILAIDTVASNATVEISCDLKGAKKDRITYVQAIIESGDLSDILKSRSEILGEEETSEQNLVISLHSCGNLVHHGLRSLVMNPSVKAVAMVGCCYNLMTERLGPPTYKLPSLRSANSRLEKTSSAFDPHGFPMSKTFVEYRHPHGEGIRLNITARMMAVQAPQNWTDADCESFFTRHFYRALLQKIFLDRGLIPKPSQDASTQDHSEDTYNGSAGGTPIIIGSLRKSCYTSFLAYVRGAVQKLAQDERLGREFAHGIEDMKDEEIVDYEQRFLHAKKELSIIWSLMAFSASVVEALIVVDRWSYLKEQPEVGDCWVETVFDYGQSPRNLVVVGIKR